MAAILGLQENFHVFILFHGLQYFIHYHLGGKGSLNP